MTLYSPDGRRLASGCDRTIIWDTGTGKELLSLKGKAHPRAGHRLAPVLSLVFSPDGQQLTSVNGDNWIHHWETSVPSEVQDRRAAHQLVADLFRQMGFRASVLERLRMLPGMNPTRRQEALTAAQTYPEDPATLNKLAWQVVNLPGRDIAGYRNALRYSEAACQLKPKNGPYLTTLGVACYRIGNYEKALETLLRADSINKTRFSGSIPADLAFLAMTRQHLGHAKEAQADLQRLRQLMKEPGWMRQDTENQGFVREAETLLANQKTPGVK